MTVAVAATAASAVGLGASSGGAYAASTPARAATSIAISVAQPSVVAGASDTVRGQISIPGVPSAGRQVTLEARTAGSDGFTPVGTATAGAEGGLSLTVQPEVDTRYRWDYAGAADAQPRMSGVALIRVQTSSHPATRLPTTLAIRSVHRTVGLGGRDTIRGQLRSRGVVLPHRWLVLQAHEAGTPGWQYRAAQRTNGHGRVKLTVQPKQRTAYRLVFLGAPAFRPARSAVVQVAVRPSVAIAVSPQRVDPGQTVTVTGTVGKGGTPAAGLSVDLLAHHTSRSTSWHVVGTGVTTTDGTVSLTDTPAVDTTYRLRLHRSTGVAAAVSAVRKVVVRDATSLSLGSRHVGNAVAITGQLVGDHKPLRGRTVLLQTQKAGGEWTESGIARTDKHGRVRFSEALVTGTSYRLAFPGGGRFAPSSSATLVE